MWCRAGRADPEAAGTWPEDNRDEVREVGIEVAPGMSAHGVPGLHFCTLNFAGASTGVLSNLGVTGPA
ncbi:MAG: methylenetetrahydrofolate reductase [Mycolicibacterium sp.]|nr:methylenetetrahydrofolate reductase [Mycolicibacterium sp.]